jgi:hypothetical protein
LSSWWWALCCSKHVEHLINIGIINSSTRLYLVGYLCMIYIKVLFKLICFMICRCFTFANSPQKYVCFSCK